MGWALVAQALPSPNTKAEKNKNDFLRFFRNYLLIFWEDNFVLYWIATEICERWELTEEWLIVVLFLLSQTPIHSIV